MNNIKKIFEYLKENQRYLWVFLVLLLTFVINKAFPAKVITSEDCANGNCQMIIEEPSLGKSDSRFYINDILESRKDNYYRLTFREKTNQDTRLSIKVTDPLDRERKIGELAIIKNYQDNFHEIIFSTDRKYSDLLFEKTNSNDKSEIIISSVKITPLNITNDARIVELKKTLHAKSAEATLSEKQEKNDYAFDQLKEPEIIFGEVFRSNIDFITEIELDLDIIKQGDGGGEKFRLVFREADFDGVTPEITSHALNELKFSFDSLEQYRQANGKFKFPIFSRVQRGSFYFVGINNDRVEVNEFNHLLVRGTKDATSYPNGSSAVKKDNKSYPAMGDIYFKIFGITFDQFENQRILAGETVEDIGGGKGIFKFNPIENRLALLDLYDYSENIDFDDGRKIIYGEIKPNKESFFTYHFETFYPFTQLNLTGKKLDPKWSNLKILYSYNNQDWQEAPSSIEFVQNEKTTEEISTQVFNFTLNEKVPKNSVYFKIIPTNLEQENFGLENLEVTANLIIKK